MEINIEEYYKQYKDIIRTCNKDGLILPNLLEEIPIPKEYGFTKKELSDLKGDSNKITKAYINRRKEDRDLSRKYDWSTKKNRDNYYKAVLRKDNKELREFVEKYPEFKNIIK